MVDWECLKLKFPIYQLTDAGGDYAGKTWSSEF